MQVPQDITLGLLWPKFTHKYCIQKEIIKYKDKVPVNKKKTGHDRPLPKSHRKRVGEG